MSASTLEAVLRAAQDRGFLGPGIVERQIEHGRDLAIAIGDFEGRFLDLGSGGGLPGLVVADAWPAANGVLLDAQSKRCEFLTDAISSLGWEGRLTVACGRAEVLARRPDLRGAFRLVVARSFGPPAVTAECGVAFLESGGRLVVTEPPTAVPSDSGRERWPPSGLAQLGLRFAREIRHEASGAVVLEALGRVGERWPRRDGMPGKRPLWD